MIARRFSALAALALLGLTACTSVPSTRTVAEEIIETLGSVPQEVKDCMTAKLEGYSDDELEAIGEGNPNFNSATDDVPVTPELQAFIDDLADCNGTPAGADPATDGTATDGTATDDTATDDTASDDTTSGEPSDTTTPTTD